MRNLIRFLVSVISISWTLSSATFAYDRLDLPNGRSLLRVPLIASSAFPNHSYKDGVVSVDLRSFKDEAFALEMSKPASKAAKIYLSDGRTFSMSFDKNISWGPILVLEKEGAFWRLAPSDPRDPGFKLRKSYYGMAGPHHWKVVAGPEYKPLLSEWPVAVLMAVTYPISACASLISYLRHGQKGSGS